MFFQILSADGYFLFTVWLRVCEQSWSRGPPVCPKRCHEVHHGKFSVLSLSASYVNALSFREMQDFIYAKITQSCGKN